MTIKDNNQLPYLKSMINCLSKVVKDGYTDDFKVAQWGLYSQHTRRIYHPDEIRIVSSFRFEGFSDPADNAMMYIIETTDNIKGTLVDACGIYADPNVHSFMKAVDEFKKKMTD